jgi:predicted ester cyclase
MGTQTRTTEQRVAVARDLVASVFNGHDPGRGRDFFTADAKWHGGALGTIAGVDNIVGLLTGFISGLPDIQVVTQDVIASGDLVAMRFVGTATQTGDVLGIPKTGKSIRWDSVDIYKITDDGKISEQWSFQDMAAILSQLGAVKLPWAG